MTKQPEGVMPFPRSETYSPPYHKEGFQVAAHIDAAGIFHIAPAQMMQQIGNRLLGQVIIAGNEHGGLSLFQMRISH